MNLLETLMKGGPAMIPIGICSIIAIAVFIEKWMHLKPEKILPSRLLQQVKEKLRERKIEEAHGMCMDRPEPGISILRAGIQKTGAGRAALKDNIEAAGKMVNLGLARGLGILSTIASIATLLGLTGTVIGMIRVFRVISIQGVGDPSALSIGIAEALICTASGLAVGITSIVFHAFFQKRVDDITLYLESESLQVLDLLDQEIPAMRGASE